MKKCPNCGNVNLVRCGSVRAYYCTHCNRYIKMPTTDRKVKNVKKPF